MSNIFDKYFDADKLEETNESGNNTYVRPSRYIAEIMRVEMKQNRNEEDIFVIEMRVLKILSEVLRTAEDKATSPNAVGTKMSQVIKFAGGGKDMALPNIKGFMNAAVPPFRTYDGKQQKEAIAFAASKEEPLKGVVLEVDAAAILTKGSKKDFTQVRYERSLSPEEVAAL